MHMLKRDKYVASLSRNAHTRRNAIPVKAKPVLACDSQKWLYFKSQTEAKRVCFGEAGLKLNTGITQALKFKVTSVLGWVVRKCLTP